MDRSLTQIDACTPGWTRNPDGELLPLRFIGQQFPDELMKPAKRKASVTQNSVCNKKASPAPPPQSPRPHRFSALAAEYTLRYGIESDDDCCAGNEGDESDTNPSDNALGSGDGDD